MSYSFLLNVPTHRSRDAGTPNNLPVVDLNGETAGIDISQSYTGGDPTLSLCTAAIVSDADSNPLVSMTIVGTDFTADDEVLKLGATPVEFPVDTNSSTTVAAGSTTFAVAYTTVDTTFIITKNGGGTAAASEWQTLLRTLSYINNTLPSTAGDRILDIAVNDGTDDSAAATITLSVAAGGAPALLNPGTQYAARNQTIIPFAVANSGGAGTWSVAGDSPTSLATLNTLGYSLDTGTGEVSATIDAAATVGVYPTKLTCTNDGGAASVTFDIDIRLTFVELDAADFGATPYYASSANVLYLLTENVSSTGTGIKFGADGVVLDGQGYSLTYDNSSPIVIVNNSFETGTGAAATGWDFTNAPNAERWEGTWLYNEVYDGDYSVKFSDPTADEYVENTTDIVLAANTTYNLTFMAEYGGQGTASTAGFTTFEMYAELVDAVGGGAPTIRCVRTTGNTRGIQLVEMQFTTTASPTYKVRVGVTGDALATAPIYLDDVKVQRTKVFGICTAALVGDADETPDITTYSVADNTAVTNCVVVQGQGNSTWAHGWFGYGTDGSRIQNSTFTVQGANSSCLYDHDAYTYESIVFHNTLNSDVTTISNRDQYYGAVVKELQGTFTYNTIEGGCHTGFRIKGGVPPASIVASELAYNTIRLKARYTNAMAIYAGRGSAIHHNTILCHEGEYSSRGIFSVGTGDVDTLIYDNVIRVQGKVDNQEYEGASLGGVYGIQLENANDVEVYNNTVYAYGNETEAFCFRANQDGGTATNLNVHDNTFTAIAGDSYAACVKLSDIDDTILTFADNALITNDGLVGATAESTQTLTRCTITANPNVSTHPFEADYAVGTGVHVELTFLDTVFSDGTSETYFHAASVYNTTYYGGGVSTRGAFTLAWTTTLHVTEFGGVGDAVGCSVVIDDAETAEVFNDVTDANGEIVAGLNEFRTLGSTKTELTPHEATADDATYIDTAAVTADQIQTVEMELDVPPGLSFPADWAGYDTPSALAAPAGTLAEFTYLISLDQMSATWWATVKSNGGDIRATKGDGTTQLPCDLIEFDYGGTAGLLAVKFTGNQTATPDDILIWCGNASASQPDATDTYGRNNTYDGKIIAFYPSGGGNDRTVNANNLSMSGSPTVGGVAGPINGSLATDYNGSSQYGTKSSPTGIPTAFPLTIAACYNPDTVTGLQVLADITSSASGTNSFMLRQNGADMRMDMRGSGTNGIAVATSSLAIGVWEVCHGRSVTATSRSIRSNGSSGTNTTSVVPSGVDRFHVAIAETSSGNYADGKLAFVTFYDEAISDDEVSYRESMLSGADPDQSDFFGTWSWTAT